MKGPASGTTLGHKEPDAGLIHSTCADESRMKYVHLADVAPLVGG
jgi:hypothetical protein